MERTLLLATLAILALVAAVAPTASADQGTADEAQDQPGTVATREAVRAANDTTADSIVLAFHEDWETHPTVEAAGWRQAYVEKPEGAPDDPFRRVHRRHDNPYPGPEATPIPAESRPHAVTVMTDDASYHRGTDARLVSPTLDLRYVRGAGASTAQAHQGPAGEVLETLHDAYVDEVDASSHTAPYHSLLVTPPARWFPLPCPDTHLPPAPCTGPVPAPDGVDLGNIPGPVIGDPSLAFIPFVPPISDATEDPSSETRRFGLYTDDGDLHAPNPVDRREGASYVNLTFWHEWDLHPDTDAAYLEVRHRRDDGSWSQWRHLEPDDTWNQQNTRPSTDLHEEAHDEPTRTYNGWKGDERVFVGSSDGLVASTFNLNRFAGTEVQLAWRLHSEAARPVDALGWFLDDVTVWTDTHQRDVGVRTIHQPRPGDAIAPAEAFRPSATVMNYGHRPVEDVRVTYRVTPPASNDTTLWRDTRTVEVLDPQEQIRLPAETPFDPGEVLDDPTGAYRLVAEVTPYRPPDGAGDDLTHRPETAPDDDNDRRDVPFQVAAEPRADVTVDVPPGSVQTDLGEPKRLAVAVENTGNIPLEGALEVTAVRLDRTTLDPVDEPRAIHRFRLGPGELPYGTALNSLGADEANWTGTVTWETGLSQAGVYRVEATFATPDGTFDDQALAYVRATPPDHYREGAEELSAGAFPEASTYRADMEVEAWTGSLQDRGNPNLVRVRKALPDPVSPTHVWFGRGDDGDLGTARLGSSAEGSAGANASSPVPYEAAEPDERPTCRPVPVFGAGRGTCTVAPSTDTRDPNLADHYWLTRDLDLDEPPFRSADEIRLTFWHSAEFDWEGDPVDDQRDASRSRGHVEVLPTDKALFTDPADRDAPEAADLPDAETGVDAVDDRTPRLHREVTVVPSDQVYAQRLATYESGVPWTREVVDLTPWRGENVTLRFHLETTADRTKVNDSGGGPLGPWLLDDLALEVRDEDGTETVGTTDLEGTRWRNWSTARGVRVETAGGDLSPATAVEGRGWERHDYGTDVYNTGWKVTNRWTRPEAGTRVDSPMFRWGDPLTHDVLPQDVNLSILRTPTFRLDAAREPVLSFHHNHTLPPATTGQNLPQTSDWAARSAWDHLSTGASVWIVGTDETGEEVVRDLLVPSDTSEARYDGAVLDYYSNRRYDNPNTPDACTSWSQDEEDGPSSGSAPGANELHCTTPLRHYPPPEALEDPERFPAEPEGNVFSGRSGRAPDEPGPARWERAVFDLSEYASGPEAALDYHVEFHAINQRTDTTEGVGWLVDDIRLRESTFANDMAVHRIADPDHREQVGPGLKVPVAVELRNAGLYDQLGVQASYVVKDRTGDVVYGPVTDRTDTAQVIPGERSDDPDKNHTIVFDKPWETPHREGIYVLEARVNLSEAMPGHAFPDLNPANDVLRQEVEVVSRRSVALKPAVDHPDQAVVSPYVATPEPHRTFEVLVENRGTLPEAFVGDDAGEFVVNLTVRDPSGQVVETTESPIRRLAPGEVRPVTFPSAWKPETTGVYEVTFRLDHPNETVPGADRDDVRTLSYTVFDRILPRGEGDGDLGSMFRPEGPGWRLDDGSWTFGDDGYRDGADDALVLDDPLEVRDLRQGVLKLNHSYGFERGYDGARVEVKPVDGDTWHPVPPRPLDEGYPVTMASASPLGPHPADPDPAGHRALSGTSGDADDPTPVETAFDLGGVDALIDRATIFDDTFDDVATRPDGARHGNWSQEYVSRVRPHSGDVMFHSNASAVEPNCWRYVTEDPSDRDEGLACDTDDWWDSRKYLNVTLDDTLPGVDTSLSDRLAEGDVEEVRVVYWDYEAIGLVDGPHGGTEARTSNEASVHLACVGDGCPADDTRTLDRPVGNGYDDSYQAWARNVHRIPGDALDPFAGEDKAVNLTFVHHLLNGNRASEWSTDGRSLHAGWFLDDVAVELLTEDGQVTTYWSDDLERHGRSHEPADPEAEDDPGRQEILHVGPWNGTAWTRAHTGGDHAHDRLLWDPVESWGEPPWRHVEEGEKPCGPLVDGGDELADQPNIEYPDDYEAGSDHFRACGPTRGHRDRAGGARLVTDVNLRPAVGNVTLTFDHAYRFRSQEIKPWDPSGPLPPGPSPGGSPGPSPPERGRPENPDARDLDVARSAGRVEVSVDGGETWIPLHPEGQDRFVAQKHNPLAGALSGSTLGAAHTTFAGHRGDPEGNSPYGVGGSGFTGVSGRFGTAPAPVDVTYDLSRFAGREIQVAWQATFGTRNTSTDGFTPDSGAYEFWAVDNVTVEADVLDGDRLDLRLHAASDGSKAAEGWTVHDVGLAGRNADRNVGVTLTGLDPDEPLPAGNTSFGLALENKGEIATRVDLQVTVRSDDGVLLEAAESGIPLDAETRVDLDAVGDRELALVLQADTSYRFEVVAEAADPAYRRWEAVRVDNNDTLRLEADQIRGDSRPVVRSVHVQPNVVPADTQEPVTVAAVVENDGFGRSALDLPNLTVTLRHRDDGTAHLNLSGKEDLETYPGHRFQDPFERRTFRWAVPVDEAGLPVGPYQVAVEAPDADDPSVSRATGSLYLGDDLLEDTGTKLDVPNASRTAEEDPEDAHSRCRSETPPVRDPEWVYPDPLPWRTKVRNHSPWRSLGADWTFEADGDQTDDATGTLLCRTEDLATGGQDLALHYTTSYSFEFADESNLYRVDHGTSEPGFDCRPAVGETLDVVVYGAEDSSRGHRDTVFSHRQEDVPDEILFEHRSTRIPADLQPEDDEKGCLGWKVFSGQRGENYAHEGIYVDDVVIAPLDVDVTAADGVAPISSHSVKRFPFRVSNTGSYQDTYRFSFQDEAGQPPDAPRDWNHTVETPDGTPIDTVTLSPGESRTLHAAVGVPVRPTAVEGDAVVPLTVESLTDEVIQDTTRFRFRYDYLQRPDLTVLSASTDNPDLPAGQLRSVTFTVANLGRTPATDVPVAVTDTMPPRFGEPPRNLTQIDGTPLPDVTLAPGQTATLVAGWTPTRPGPHEITVHVDPEDDVVETRERDNVEVLDVPVEAAAFPDLTVDVEPDATEPRAGTSVDLTGTITNNGDAPAQGVRVTFRVGVADLLDGDGPHVLGEPVAPGETVELNATWPASFHGDYTALLRAIPLSGSLEPADRQDDNLDVENVTVRSPGLDLPAREEPVPVGQADAVTVPVTLSNRADRSDTADLVAEAPGDLRAQVLHEGVSVPRIDVPARDEVAMDLQVRTPTQVAAGSYPVTLEARSQATGQTETTAIPVAVEPEPGLALETRAVDADPGGGTVPVQVENTGNVPADVTLSLQDPPQGWSLSGSASLDPFEATWVEARLETPTDTPAGVTDLVVAAEADQADATDPLRVDVESKGLLEVGLDPGSLALRPGRAATLQATLESVGNAPAYADLRLEAPAAWDASLPRPRASILSGETLTFPVPVEVPSSASPGTRTATLVAETPDDRFAAETTVEVGVPDLVVTRVEQNPRVNVKAGEDVAFATTVRNVGGLPVDGTGLGLYVDDRLVDHGDLGPLPAGTQTEANLDWTATADESVVLVVADPAEEVAEDDEGNNARLFVLEPSGRAEVFGEVQRAVPAAAGLPLLALLAAALARRRT